MLSDQVLECKDLGACICAMNDAEVMSHVQFEVMLEYLGQLASGPHNWLQHLLFCSIDP